MSLDLKGKKFGKLTVLKKVEKPEKRKLNGSYWLCKCECGKKCVANGSSMKRGIPRSCGCLTKEHIKQRVKKKLEGEKIGFLTVLREVEPILDGKETRRAYLCECDCGNKKVYNVKQLYNKMVTSCGCVKSIKEDRTKINLYKSYQLSAKQRGLEFNISYANFLKLTSDNCFYCGCEPWQIKETWGQKYIYNGIDRKNNQEGYTKENSLTCCKTCNYMKHSMNFEKFLEHIEKIFLNQKKKGVK